MNSKLNKLVIEHDNAAKSCMRELLCEEAARELGARQGRKAVEALYRGGRSQKEYTALLMVQAESLLADEK